jgi:hypothetical protein
MRAEFFVVPLMPINKLSYALGHPVSAGVWRVPCYFGSRDEAS